jgi:hypothetical protein
VFARAEDADGIGGGGDEFGRGIHVAESSNTGLRLCNVAA